MGYPLEVAFGWLGLFIPMMLDIFYALMVVIGCWFEV